MNRRGLAYLAFAAVLAIAAALYLDSVRNRTHTTQGQRLLPALADELATVTSLSIRKGAPSPTVTVHRVRDQWTVAERGDYPADVGKLRKLLTALSEARVVEEKTANPANFAVIGVDDPGGTGAVGTELKLAAKAGTRAIIVGNASGEGSFVRQVGENQSFLVEPALAAETDPHAWIDPRLIDIPPATIKRIEVKLEGAPAYVLRRVDAKDGGFALDGAPLGRKPLDAPALVPGMSMFGTLNAEDVAPVGDIDFGKASRATVTLSDGGIISLEGAIRGDGHWLSVKSDKDAALSAKADGRAFEIPSYRYDGIFRPVEQLLVPPATPSRTKPKAP